MMNDEWAWGMEQGAWGWMKEKSRQYANKITNIEHRLTNFEVLSSPFQKGDQGGFDKSRHSLLVTRH